MTGLRLRVESRRGRTRDWCSQEIRLLNPLNGASWICYSGLLGWATGTKEALVVCTILQRQSGGNMATVEEQDVETYTKA